MVDRPPFPIPSELTPDTFCLQIQCPNNDDWKHVLYGLLMQPAYWFNWDRDSEHSGKTLAAYWNEIVLNIDWSIMSCCCDQPPAIFRYNSDGVYQRSTDGGSTWTDAPNYDYRNTSTEFPPPSALGITNSKCQAADGVVFVINDEIVQSLDEAFAAAQILALIAAVLLALLSAGSLAALTPLITAIGSAIIDVGVTATQAAFTTDVKNRLRCNVFNHMTSDDATDQAGFEAILAQITTDESGIAETILYGVVNAAGLVGINNMIRSNKGDPDADCSCGTGCDDLPNWTLVPPGVTNGAIVSQSTTLLEATGAVVAGDGNFYCQLQSDDDANGCTFSLIEHTGNSFSLLLAWNLVGETRATFTHTGSFTDILGININCVMLRTVDANSMNMHI